MAEEDSKSFILYDSNVQTTLAVSVLVLLVIKLAMTVNKKKHYKLPPGPWGLPLVGYLPFFGPDPPVTFVQLRKKYGDVISITMGSWPAIVINGRDAAMEALVSKGDDFSGRPPFYTSLLLSEGRSFAFSIFGAIWKMQRKIVVNIMHTYSNYRNTPFEDIVRSEAKSIVEEFVTHGDKRFCPLDPLKVAAHSTIYQLCFGLHRNIRQDPHFVSFLELLDAFVKFSGAGNPVDVIPWLRFVLPSKVSRLNKLVKNAIEGRIKKVEEHETTFDKSNMRDITDGLINAGNNLSEREKAIGLDKRRMVETLDTIFGAAGNTMTTVLQWFVGLMAVYPEAQEKLFQQVIRAVGQGRDVTWADRVDVPLMEATLYEVLRYATAVPFALPHMTICDTTLKGYDIPQGTVVLVNLHSIYMDEELWGDPKSFRPERFLDAEGHLDKGLTEQVTAFSLGRRRCLGEVFARTEMFLFCTTLIQHLKFYKPPGQAEVVLKPYYGLTRDLEPFEICVCQRA